MKQVVFVRLAKNIKFFGNIEHFPQEGNYIWLNDQCFIVEKISYHYNVYEGVPYFSEAIPTIYLSANDLEYVKQYSEKSLDKMKKVDSLNDFIK